MTAAAVAAILRAFSSSPSSDRLVTHFHGGLVSATEGMAIAKRLQADYSNADHSAVTPAGLEIYFNGFTLETIEAPPG